MDAIVAVYSDWGIGAGGTQPVVLKADRAQFKRVTDGKTVIVGRRTLADFPNGRPLKGRRNIVVTRQNILIDGAFVAHSVAEAAELCKDEATVVIGGASVYRDFFPLIDRVFGTTIDLCPVSDSFLPHLDELPGWPLVDNGEELHEGDIAYRFTVHERK